MTNITTEYRKSGMLGLKTARLTGLRFDLL